MLFYSERGLYMTSLYSLDKPNNLKEWLELHKEFIKELRNKELTNNDTHNFYNKLLESNIFGNSIYIRVIKIIPYEKSDLIIAKVLEPTKNGFQVCPDPLNQSQEWNISTLSKKSLHFKPMNCMNAHILIKCLKIRESN